jgi:hypothetical protein
LTPAGTPGAHQQLLLLLLLLPVLVLVVLPVVLLATCVLQWASDRVVHCHTRR